ncbi:unnamed protein product [Phytophthora lilii]|uniref:Unnamed protein product n=1 Tax=Phytophthora lilii TaxID=2077276 RepID=A0A9W6TW38_9STRA|nr:unnamed protein product [Phytophthora lilii]
MMTESNNLLYHPHDGGFDRLEEMEGGALTRYPVLRSVPVPMPRPWSTRGAIALLMVCGVVFGVIAIITMSNSQASEEASAESAPGGRAELIAGGSGSLGIGTVSESSWQDETNPSAESTSNSGLDNPSSESTGSSSSLAGEATSRLNDSASASSFEEVTTNLLGSWTNDSELGSSGTSESDASEPDSASADNMQDILISASDLTDSSLEDWFGDSSSASSADDSSSASIDSEPSDSESQSGDSSLGF